jgi:type IX secretion system PorP/SprF family membrane protein
MRRIIIYLFVLVGITSLNAQDIHFSQFYLSPLNLNPAMTGVMNCNSRLVANYRNQWASVLKSNAFSTYSVSYDQRIPVGRDDYFGVGGVFWGDRAGESRFSTTTAKLSLSYSKRIGGDRKRSTYFVAGAQGGVAQRSIDFLNLRWPNQHDGEGGFDPTKASGENTLNDNFLFADAEAGMLIFHVSPKGSLYAGLAAHHLNRANQSFFEGEENLLYTRFTGHLGAEAQAGQKLAFVPGIIVMKQGPSFQVNAGNSFKFILSQDKYDYQAFQVGAWARIANRYETPEQTGLLMDAAILSTRFDYNNFSLGFSYDINVSDLATASNGNGAFEFALVYKICGEERRNLYCPRF